jgi:hypothetical protein
LEKLTKAEERIAGAVGHMFECMDEVHKARSGVLIYTETEAAHKYDRAVKVFRAALAMHELERATTAAKKAVDNQGKGKLIQ